MPSVVTYWQLPEEETDFIDFVSRTGDIFAIVDYYVDSPEKLNPIPVADLCVNRFGESIIIGNSHDLKTQIESREFDGETMYSVSLMNSNVIGYKRPTIRDGKLALSNLCAYYDYLDDLTHTIKPKNTEFVAWAKKVLGWARRRTKERMEYRGYPYRATVPAKEAYESRQIDIITI